MKETDKITRLELNSSRIMIRTTIAGQINQKKKIQIYLKIIINYLQVLSIINSYEMKWPSNVSIFMKYYSSFSMTSSFMSLDCIFYEYNINFEPLYIETMIIIATPFCISLGGFTIMCFFYYKKRKSQKIRFVAMYIAINALLQPAVVSKLLENFKCRMINNTCYLLANANIDYNSHFHQKWVIL